MAFSIIEVLKLGQTEYIDKFRTSADIKSAIKWIRLSPYKEDIAKACQNDFDRHPYFWLEIIYDLDSYFFLALEMRKKYRLPFTKENYENILYNSKYGENYIYENFDNVISFDESFVNILLQYVIERSKNKNFWLDFLTKNINLHIRALTMLKIINDYPKYLKLYGNDLTIYFTNNIGNVGSQISLYLEKMDSKDVSLIAYNLFLKGHIELFNQVKDFLFKNYEKNYLAYNLCEGCWTPIKNDIRVEIFGDLERYFLTDSRLQFSIYKNYRDKLRNDIIDDFRKRLRILDLVENRVLDKFQTIYFYELGRKLELYIEKYLDLSQNKKVGKVGEGTTCYALRLGDFVLKLINTKWSYEECLCPDLFLIVKNLEQDYVRSEKGIVLCGLEVQPYLTRSVRDFDLKYLDYFKETLNDLGFFINDSLISEFGDNVRVLNSYKDADTDDCESLPEWFKEVPVVLVDRDRVYSTDRIEIYPFSGVKRLRIKQISGEY